MRTTVESVTSIVVTNPGKSTAVSIPLTVTWVCSDGSVISVEAPPSNLKAVYLEAKESDKVVARNVNSVVSRESVFNVIFESVPCG